MSRERMQWSSRRGRDDKNESTVLKQFERGTLVEVAPYDTYKNRDLTHVYYVSERARRKEGTRKVHQMDAIDEFFDESEGNNWEAIKDHVSAVELAEFAEARSVESTDGALSQNQGGLTASTEISERESNRSTPTGIIKFGDSTAISDGRHDPEDRGRCWASIRDRPSSQPDARRLNYQNDLKRTPPSDLRIPPWVSEEGTEAITGYLVAHDYPDWGIITALDINQETLQGTVKDLGKTDSTN